MNMMIDEELKNVKPNQDNDKLFRDTIKKQKNNDGTFEESTSSEGKLEYFTE